MQRLTPRRLVWLTVGIDMVVITMTMFATFSVLGWSIDSGAAATAPVWLFALVVGGWLLAMHQFRAYSARRLTSGLKEFKRVIVGSVLAAGAMGIANTLGFHQLSPTAFVTLFTAGTVALLGARLTRRVAVGGMHRRGTVGTPVLVAGEPGKADGVIAALKRERWHGYRVAGVLTTDGAATTPLGHPVQGSLGDLRRVLVEEGVHTVIFTEGSFACTSEFRRMAWDLERENVQMVVAPTISDVSHDRLHVRHVGGLALVEVEAPRAAASTRWAKRTFDIVVTSLILLAVAPVMGIVALAIKLEDRGPVLFRQARVGRGDREFSCLKFRSMCVDAEARLAALQAENEGAGGVLFKMKNDPRITRVGAFIRRYSLDELPQLWNVVRGDMSLVGPRPALAREVAKYDSDMRHRLDVRPGLTGLWQVSGRSRLSWEDTVRLDLYYVDNWSMTQDIAILAKTFKAVVGSDGAY